jgi:hypothetical protein
VKPAARGFAVVARIENRRDQPLQLQPDACGHPASAVLMRTAAQERGRRWPRSVQRVKDFVLERQTADDRRPAALQPAGDCEPRSAPVEIAPGKALVQRWSVKRSPLLDEIGARHARVKVEVNELGHRRASAGSEGSLIGLVEWPARTHRTSAAEHFDRLLADARLYRLLATQPADAWRAADLTVTDESVVLKAYSRRHVQPITATAGLSGGPVQLTTPKPDDLLRPDPPDLPWS